VKTVDGVYKEAKLLRASVKNSERIDRALEKALNIVFYTIMGIIILGQIGYDPFTIFLSISSLTLAVAWMIGSASAKMFEGWLFILVRRPVSMSSNAVFTCLL
jgi:small-conductance mechanosensitive channel